VAHSPEIIAGCWLLAAGKDAPFNCSSLRKSRVHTKHRAEQNSSGNIVRLKQNQSSPEK